jgi:hypothetical protein
MPLGTNNEPKIQQQLVLSQLAGNPTYFFNTSFLLATITTLADWNQSRLEAAIAPRLDRTLNGSDLRFTADNGFYIVFSSPDIGLAKEKANAICTDLLRHFFGDGNYLPQYVERLCRQSSVEQVCDDLGITPAPERDAFHLGGRGPLRAQEPSESEKDKLLFRRQLTELYSETLDSSSAGETFLFSPCWDSQKERINSFVCEFTGTGPPEAAPGATGLPVAIAQCERDVTGLAIATRGVRHLLGRGDFAAVSVPVRAETLSWSKTRNGYFGVLSEIEPRILQFIAPRIIGFHAGTNLSLTGQWIAEMRRFVSWIFVHLPELNVDFFRVGTLGASGFGLTVASLSTTKARLNTLEMDADKLKRICAFQNAIAYADNVGSVHELNVLRTKGIRILAGPVIGLHSEMPGPLRSLSFKVPSH